MKVKAGEMREFIESNGFSHFGFVSLSRTLTADLFERWVDDGFHGEMEYLQTSKARRREPTSVWPEMKSAVVFTMDYVPHPHASESPLKSQGLALYARGEDYHRFLKRRLNELTLKIKERFVGETVVFTDSAPILEREWAVRAGLGWIGKNSCLIHKKKGSLFFIAEILTSIEVTDVEEFESVDLCGKCRKCIDSCPTGAIQENRTLDSNLCISYLTIEAKSVAPESLRDKMSSYFFGCDICQIVCPWTVKFSDPELKKEARIYATDHSTHEFALSDANQEPVSTRFRLRDEEQLQRLKSDVTYILSSSSKKLQKDLALTAVSRSAGLKLKRNALYIVAEQKWKDLVPLVEPLLVNESLGDLAQWCIRRTNES